MSFHGYTQNELKRFVLQNAVALSGENSDNGFKIIGEAIGEAKIVFIGEQDHGNHTDLDPLLLWITKSNTR